MLSTESEFLNIIIAIFIYSWLFTIAYGCLIALSYPIFKKTNSEEAGCFIPLYNLFSLCSLNGFDQKIAFLFLIPFINIIMSMIMSYKLKDSFNTSGAFNIGLLLFPIFFVPLLAYGNVNSAEEKIEEEPEEIKVPEENVNDIDVDSIFKTDAQTKELENKPYKAKRVQVNQTFINSAPAEAEKIEKLD